MAGFPPDWLALREPTDVTARSSRLAGLVCDELRQHTVLRALDLATGTGANFRYLAERLPRSQDWLLVDHDAQLLAEVTTRTKAWGAERGIKVVTGGDGLLLRGDRLVCRCAMRRVDLLAVIDKMEADVFAGRALVTASALLDLVSVGWLRALAAKCVQAKAAVLFALTYDGSIRCSPEEPEDETIRELVNQHQRSDKGFGPALGPTAIDLAERSFADLGYHVERERSDWVLERDARDVQRQLIEGWAKAATDMSPPQSASIRSWQTRRLVHVAAGRSRLLVGHQDLAAWMPRM
jgi:hypothetical protein